MKFTVAATGLFFVSILANCQQTGFDGFSRRFVSGYKALNMPALTLSYVSGFEQIKSPAKVREQLDFFRSVAKELPDYDPAKLNPTQKTDYELIAYETKLNLERVNLELGWLKNKPDTISKRGVLTLPNGKAWYAYLLKRWVNADVTPDEIYKFGLGEVERVKGHLELVRKQTGLNEDEFYQHLNDPPFFISDPSSVQKAFEETKTTIYGNLHNVFYDFKIPNLKIERSADKQFAQVPGYYNDNVFYYNLFDKPYNRRQIDWLFMHEAVPGHHYQASIATASRTSDVEQLFFYLGYAEGWAAYTEELGKQLGVYKTAYDELGKWEWDIVRSVRVPLDVGLNYYGWTDEQALAFWKKNIRNQDDIAMREINRMRRWPAQVVTYKYGALQLLHWKEELQEKQGDKFNIKDFHKRVLENGTLPLFMVKENVFKGQ